MLKEIRPYRDLEESKKQQITIMFNKISKNYDFLNRLISLGIDISWRRKVVEIVKKMKSKRILDVATGTGDLAIMQGHRISNAEVVGLDISSGMLEIAKLKVKKLRLEKKVKMILGDVESIPFQDGFFDAITVAYGLRNFENLDKALREIKRVLRIGGIFIVLETSVPKNIFFNQLYKMYTKFILPFIGEVFSKDRDAYAYLSESANSFPHGVHFESILEKNGFKSIKSKCLTFGVSSIYRSIKS